jgi:hypothetical protein
MNQYVRKYLEKKLVEKQSRLKQLDFDAMANENFILDPSYSKLFGFPDNSAVLDPDNSLLSNS